MKKNLMKFDRMVFITLIVCLALTGCSGSGGNVAENIDVASLADELNSETITTDTLTQTAEEMLPQIYFYSNDQVTDCKVYMSSNSTADEIAVFECASKDDAEAVEKLLETRVTNQKTLFETYNAEEAAKLDDAITQTSGVYAVLVVCDDYDKAKEILENAGF